MTLTTAQKEYVRDNSGDDLEPYEISDASIQAIYDDATQGNSDLDRVIVFVLRRRLGKAARMVSLSGEFGSAQHNQKYEQIERLIQRWEGMTGLGGSGILSAGVLNLGIDEPCPDGMTCDD